MHGSDDVGPTRHEIRISLLERTLAYCADEYAVSERAFANLDAKAQATFAIAGVFIAGVLAFISDESLRDLAGSSTRMETILVLAVTALVLSAFLCLVAMGIRRVSAPLESEDVARMADDILSLTDDELTRETYENWFRDRIAVWQPTLVDVRRVNANKASWILWAQVVLGVAVVFGAWFTLEVIPAS